MKTAEILLFEALRCAVTGTPLPWTESPDLSAQKSLARLARAQALTPLIAQALDGCPAVKDSSVLATMRREARQITMRQAVRTGEFLLLLRELDRRGLRPLVLKGAVCRSLYPEPEQRPSTDEDLLIPPEDFRAYHEALLACGLRLLKPEEPPEEDYEVTYVDPDRDLYVELHKLPFAPDSDAYGDCNACVDGAFSRRTALRLYGESIDTLCPTDHLQYLLCHAYKHILYGGVGLRQICDICLFARRYGSEIDWARVRGSCEDLKIETLAAAFFRIGERHLAIPGPAGFADLDPEEGPLLQDCLAGGLYGAEDLDRMHSSALTLDAVAADRQGRRRHGLLKALFPDAKTMSVRFPYLQKRPWLLPVAWTQRILRYTTKNRAPTKSLHIGQERVALLRHYGVLD
ncbi:MAG: nucleotidyltransferase family protein [Oscillospiraceae bacterium]|nr:nucleotidyltransferase family protein [Clostridia bacterium]MBQ6272868.1 nucleotidyltransferase family protein [Oscillospiraceae bacterium]